MKISVVGSGYVGLITAAGFAEKDHDVICVDIDKRKVDMINARKPPIFEKGLQEILDHVVPENLKASLNLEASVLKTDVTFICVGTPSDDDGSINLKYVKEVSREVGKILKKKKGYHVVVVKSTIIPGSTEEHVIPALEKESGKKAGRDFGVVMNPEFLREGVAVDDFLNPDRIVIGSLDERGGDLIEKLYYDFTAPVLRVNLKTAEMIKYTSNSLLATKISFINEIGNVCKRLNVNVYDVAKGVGLDHRISPSFLNAGPGFGGSCFPKDVKAMVHKAQEVDVDPILLNAVLEVNARQPQVLLDLVRSKYELKGAKVTVLGLAFKAGTDDMRESPSVPIVRGLIEEGAEITAYDPEAIDNAKDHFKDSIKYASTVKDALKDSELAVIVTEWPEFKTVDFSPMKKKRVVDSRHILNVDLLADDVEYEGLCW
ncbi:MAG: nucleotide sugar dehydrogenase [Candidatus Altiarchaeales archaeon]|nr:nucleotide sugar dehydrogenase [Candidatus Altiarchaeales archaeon]MBD3416622.1 nucleotide sugar dehydrogenase [Candidatus Altiarchaeales archaeon]